MINLLNPFAGWVTNSTNKAFLSARLKLTGSYTVLLVLILTCFSVAIYYALSKNIKDVSEEGEGKFVSKTQEQMFVRNATSRLKGTILWIDGVVLFLAAGSSYFLAGKTLKPIRQALENESRFAADASHELRTPLSILQLDCETALRRKNFSQTEMEPLLQSNLEEVNRMSQLVNDLLFVTRSEALKPNRLFSKCDLSGIVNDTFPVLKKLASQKNINLTVQNEPGCFVKGNALLLRQMAHNLIQNAIQYTPEGKTVAVRVKNEMKSVFLIVQDTGLGIPRQDIPHIFKRFYKGDPARTAGTGGAGLGLSIVKKIVELHNGKIKVESSAGSGTTVTVTFPV